METPHQGAGQGHRTRPGDGVRDREAERRLHPRHLHSRSGLDLRGVLARVRRRWEDAPRLKVLFTSGYTDDAGIRQGALDSGMGFLSKPFTPEALVRKAREMLDQPS